MHAKVTERDGLQAGEWDGARC